jgi:DNA-binding MarR family transcriptional regulator
MAALISARFIAHDLSFEQWIALKSVWDGTVRSAGELAREMEITTGATTRMIDGLETRGLLRRERIGGDRRVVQLVITPAGIETIIALHPHVLGVWNEVMADFGEDEAAALAAGLSKLQDAATRAAATLAQRAEAAE